LGYTSYYICVDPLAVLLLIASQYTFEYYRRKDDGGERLRREYEQLRAQKIANNPGFTVDTPTPTQEEEVDERVDQPTDSNIQDGDVEPDERDREANDEEDLSGRSEVEPVEEQVPDSTQVREEPSTIQDTGADTESIQELSEEEQQAREQYFNEQDATDAWKDAKSRWKADHPNETLKEHKIHYIKGVIEELPWESYVQNRTYIKQDPEGQHTVKYEQNAEQDRNSMWKRIRDNESD
jgi:hypothetical protein